MCNIETMKCMWVQQDTEVCKRDSGHTLDSRIDTRGSFREYEPREGRDEKQKKSSLSYCSRDDTSLHIFFIFKEISSG